MPPLPGPTLVENNFWSTDTNPCVNVDILMPNGIIIPMLVYKNDQLQHIKRDLWKEATKYPLYGHLKSIESYVFMCVNQAADHEEIDNENKRLHEVRPFQSILKVVEKTGNRAEKVLNSQIGNLIGKGVHEFEALSNKNQEVKMFRSNMKKMCDEITANRLSKNWMEQVLYHFPLDICLDEFPPYMLSKLKNSSYMVNVKVEHSQTSYHFRIRLGMMLDKLVNKVYDKLANTGQHRENIDQYVLKVCGKEEYLIGQYALDQFKYIRTMIASSKTPTLKFVLKSNLRVEGVPINSVMSSTVIERPRKHSISIPSPEEDRPPIPPRTNPKVAPRKQASTDLWAIQEDYRITIEGVKNVPCGDNCKVALRIGVFHGGDTLCDIMNTPETLLKNGEASWDTDITFSIKVCDLPRMAKLCFTLYQKVDNKTTKFDKTKGTLLKKLKNMKHTQEVIGLAWVNIPVFDYNDILQLGQQTLHMWPLKEDLHYQDDILNYLGIVVQNPMEDNAIAMGVILNNFNAAHPILYPSFEKVLECAARAASYPDSQCSDEEFLVIEAILKKDSLHQYCENEKELIWNSRLDVHQHFTYALPKLLLCVKWQSHIDTSLMQALLQIWPKLFPQQALELLDFAYADKSVRKFAVQCLKKASDAEILQYLLQLVQVLKYESYLENDLVEFLLDRALNNKRIGHYFFWLIRSEMHVPSVSVRFGLTLEAYCRGCEIHIRSLSKQNEVLDKLRAINQLVKGRNYNPADKRSREQCYDDMRSILKMNAYVDALSDLSFPVDPVVLLKTLTVDKCKFMHSKMRPLLLVWENNDYYGEDVKVIFKNGDDLRQDMLTLQILKIMDSIWQEAGLDLRLSAYGCISTGQEFGMIEMVKESDTIANIQKEYANIVLKSAFNKQSLWLWLKKHNKDDESLNEAVEQFTLSCAGYCVATYVLGIGDRHSDNIMMRTNGQLFHIDFGHFLGNFKSKFGVKRERVPFVLTNDFVYVINNGHSANSSVTSFSRFKDLCEQAFLILRKKGNLLITLFMMMLSTGIPELTCVKDIQYLSDTMVLDKSEEEACKHFRGKFNEALKNSWKTSLNWVAHNLAKDNK